MFPEERDTGSFKAAKYNQSLLLSTHKQFGLLSSSERREKSAILGLPSRCSGWGGESRVEGRFGQEAERHEDWETWPGASPLQGQIDVKSLYPGGLSVCLLCVHTRCLGQNSLKISLGGNGKSFQLICTHTHSVLKDINKLTPELLFTTMLRSDNHYSQTGKDEEL